MKSGNKSKTRNHFFEIVSKLPVQDKVRVIQCTVCSESPGKCRCTWDDEDENGFFKRCK